MKIAIASTGLGHVARGVEAWALGLAGELADQERYPEVDVTLFAGAQPGIATKNTKKHKNGCKDNRGDCPVKTGEDMSGSGVDVVVVRCLKRGERITRMLARITPGFMWRWGLKNVYGWEQFTFWLHLAPMLRRGGYDILHTQDALLADWCRRARQKGCIATKEILAHGTDEPHEFLRRFDYLQHLAPYHADALKAEN